MGLLLVGSLLATLVGPAAAHAQGDAERQREVDAAIEAVREELDELAAHEAELLGELRVTRQRRADEDGRLAALDQQLHVVLAELAAAQERLDSAIAADLEAQRTVDAIRRRAATARRSFSDQVVSAYVHGARVEAPVLPATPEGLTELGSVRALGGALRDKQAALIDQLESLELEHAAARREAVAARAAAAEVRDEVESRTRELEAARAAQARSRSEVAAEAAHEERVLAAVQGERDQHERRIQALQAESEAIGELLRQVGSSGVAISGTGSLGSPLDRSVITSSFGYRIHPIYGDRRLHAGVDMRGTTGTPIRAAGAGEVVFAGVRGGYGNCVIIAHGGGVATLYAHQSSLAVSVGDAVARGDVIGAVGSSGYSTGPHLHFEVRVDGVPVDPLRYL